MNAPVYGNDTLEAHVFNRVVSNSNQSKGNRVSSITSMYDKHVRNTNRLTRMM